MIRTGIANVEALLNPSTYRAYYEMAPCWRREKADRFKFQKDKALSIGAWILYERLREEWQVPEHAVYNLSHSGSYVLCSLDTKAAAEQKAGCDIEQPGKNQEGIARRFFTEAECAYIDSGENEAARVDFFYRLWVLKESYVKARRVGLSLGLDTFEIGFTAAGKPYLRKDLTGNKEPYYFKEYPYRPEAGKIAVCSNSPDFAAEIFTVTLGDLVNGSRRE